MIAADPDIGDADDVANQSGGDDDAEEPEDSTSGSDGCQEDEPEDDLDGEFCFCEITSTPTTAYALVHAQVLILSSLSSAFGRQR